MVKRIVIEIPHDLGRHEALQRVQRGLDQLKATLQRKVEIVQSPWVGDSANFSVAALGQTVNAKITVEADRVNVEGSLPLLLSGFASKATAFIQEHGTLLLGDR